MTDNLYSLIRKLEMTHKRQSDTLKETENQLAALREMQRQQDIENAKPAKK